jgi:hypothetical protein
MDFFGSMAVLIDRPALALLPAVLLLILFAISKNRLALAAGSLWGLYCLYEYAMKYRVLCSGECNIRIDLFVIYPTLVLALLVGIASGLHSIWRHHDANNSFK